MWETLIAVGLIALVAGLWAWRITRLAKKEGGGGCAGCADAACPLSGKVPDGGKGERRSD